MSSLGDALGYFAFRNPVSQTILYTLGLQSYTNNTKAVQPVVVDLQKILWQGPSTQSAFVRLAGFGASSAIIMGVYGKSVLSRPQESLVKIEGKLYFDSAQRFHLSHSVALMAMPLVHRPILSGSLMATGIVLYCSATYYRALTGNKNLAVMASLGGYCLLAAWISICM